MFSIKYSPDVLNIFDFLLGGIYFFIIILVALIYRYKLKSKILRYYFMPALLVRMLGAIFIGLIYEYYYHGGDTFNFYWNSTVIWHTFWVAPFKAIRIIFANGEAYSPDLYEYTRYIYFLNAGDLSSFNVVRVGAIFSLFTFNSYIVIALFFAVLSLTGLWAMYKALLDMFPRLAHQLAWATFFIPSVFFWGSGYMKDTLTLTALGWGFYGFYFGLIKRERVARNLIIFFLAVYIIKEIKIYILGAMIPAIFPWLFLHYQSRIKSQVIRVISLPFMMLLSIPAAIFTFSQVTAENEQYRLENIAVTTQQSSEWLGYVSEKQGGSGYSLGEMDGTLAGMVSKAPQAIWIGLFQPHIWQARNPVMLLSALEATIFLLLTLWTLWKVRLSNLIGMYVKHPVLLFCLLFSLILAFGVTMASFNYGTMVRYRIPFMPFYMAMLLIIRYLYQLENMKKKMRRSPEPLLR